MGFSGIGLLGAKQDITEGHGVDYLIIDKLTVDLRAKASPNKPPVKQRYINTIGVMSLIIFSTSVLYYYR